MESIKLHTVRPPNLDNFIDFMNDAIATFIMNKGEADFPVHYVGSMIRNLACVLLMAPRELNVHDLVVEVFQVCWDLKLEIALVFTIWFQPFDHSFFFSFSSSDFSIQIFPDEGHVYTLIEVLARRHQCESFVKCVLAIFLTFPPVKIYKVNENSSDFYIILKFTLFFSIFRNLPNVRMK